MVKNSRVTICVPTYNAEPTLAETLNSIASQSFRDIRILIVDNASTDRTMAIASEFAATDTRIELFPHEENIGGEGNFTRCLQLAEGDYTAIYHADDIYTENMVSLQVKALDADNTMGAVFTTGHLIDGNGQIYGNHNSPDELFTEFGGKLDLAAALSLLARWGNFFICPSAMVRTAIYQSIGSWDRGRFGSSSDLDMWLRILQHHPVQVLADRLINIRTSDTSFSYHYGFLRNTRADFYKVMDEYLFQTNPDQVTPRDLLNYEFKNYKECIGLAFNALMTNDPSKARVQVISGFSTRTLANAIRDPAWLKFLLIGDAIWLMSFLPIPEFLKRYLIRLRYGQR